MDTKVAILSGLLVTLLIGSGLLIVIDNTGDNQDKENGVVDEIIQDPIDTNQKPVVFVPDVSKSWDGENTILSGFIYDESAGIPDENIPAGTRWEDVPINWLCPECGARKEDFEMVEI